jgi:thiol-disulfide isomerase/thioredoxin
MKAAPIVLLAAVLAAPVPAGAVAVGDPAPALALATADGRTVEIGSLRGKAVWVDFWASWCGPCKRSFPWMNEMHAKYGGRGLEIVAVNVDKRREDAEKFLAVAPARFTVVYDPAGTAPAAWQVKAMPTSYLVDANGRVAFVESGFHDDRKAGIEDRIRSALPGR